MIRTKRVSLWIPLLVGSLGYLLGFVGCSGGGSGEEASGAESFGGAESAVPQSAEGGSDTTESSGESGETSSPPDTDGDGLLDPEDNCPEVANPGQENHDFDAHGDACDNCPEENNENQLDTDLDGVGDLCDNCPAQVNPGQEDEDHDRIGDPCDPVDDCPDDVLPSRDLSGTYRYRAEMVFEELPYDPEQIIALLERIIRLSDLTDEQKEALLEALAELEAILSDPSFSGSQRYTQEGPDLLSWWEVDHFSTQPLSESFLLLQEAPGCFQTPEGFRLMPTPLEIDMTALIIDATLTFMTTVVESVVEDPDQQAAILAAMTLILTDPAVQESIARVFGDIDVDTMTIGGPVNLTPDPATIAGTLTLHVEPGEGSDTEPSDIPLEYSATHQEESLQKRFMKDAP